MKFVHYSEVVDVVVHKCRQREKPYSKPSGLWCSTPGGPLSWRDYIEENGLRGGTAYLEECGLWSVEVNMDKILQLTSARQIEEFTAQYALGDQWRESIVFSSVRWQWLAQDYHGIYTSLPRIPNTPDWLSDWDVISCCIWHPDAIISLVEERPPSGQFAGNRLSSISYLWPRLELFEPEPLHGKMVRRPQQGSEDLLGRWLDVARRYQKREKGVPSW